MYFEQSNEKCNETYAISLHSQETVFMLGFVYFSLDVMIRHSHL